MRPPELSAPELITQELAVALEAAGLVWHPRPGDRFAILREGFAGDVFTLSEMTIEAHATDTGTVLGFNGTTEWALDSTDQADALWLPREDQLRVLLAGTFRRLERTADGYVVTAELPGGVRQFTADLAADAYALAVLDLVSAATADV